MANRTSPASGEQSAIAGYFVQYEFSASTIYRLMQAGELDGISNCDHSAGIFDDLVVFCGLDVLAHQIKSERYVKAFRLRTELLTHRLIEKIAKSWKSLQEEYPGKRICIRFVFGGFPSVSDKADFEHIGHSAELFAFLSDDASTLSKDELLNSKWGAFIRELNGASGLDEREFFDLFRAMTLYDQQEIVRRQVANLDRYGQKKARDIKHLLPTIIAERATRRFWSEEDIVDRLGWTRSASPRALHTFPVQPDVQENAAVEERLRETIEQTTSGYISLLGPPGTGKSTTLQRAILSTPSYGVARYLAFLPDERHGLGRAEATDFLNDITFELGRLGFSRPRFAEERELLMEFQNQLVEAGEVFERSDRKTLIIVDGLDHIHREEEPRHSLLKILPIPSAIPDGVLFILGTQFLALDGLRSSIVQQASQQDRSVDMKPLPKSAIFEMADKASLPAYVDRNALYSVCDGHPLIARYYIEKLLETRDQAEADNLLSSTAIGASIEQMYGRVWNSIALDEEAKHVLALVARAEKRISPMELASVVNNAAVERVLKKAGFLLSGREERAWSVFHNSFRVFIASRTRERFEKEDTSLDVLFYRELACVAREAEDRSEQRWLELRYSARAGDTDAIKALATPERFRRELSEFRGGQDVYADLRLAYGAVESYAELTKFVQLLLVEKEIDYRLEAISELDFVDVYVDFGERDIAFQIALSSAERNDGTYDLIDTLYADGDVVRSRQLFEAIEPLDMLLGLHDRRLLGAEQEVLFDWADRVHRFRSIPKALEIISGISFDEHLQTDPRKSLKFAVARGIVFDDPAAHIDGLQKTFGLTPRAVEALKVHALLGLDLAGDEERIQTTLKELEDLGDEIGQTAARVGTRIAYEHGHLDVARHLFCKVCIRGSKRFGDYESRSKLDSMFAGIFSVARLSEHLELDLRYEPIDGDDFQDRIVENVITLGRLLAKIEKASKPMEVASVRQHLADTCLLLAHLQPEESPHSWDPIVGNGLSWYASTIVRIASLHSIDTLKDVEAQVERLYERGENRLARFSYFRLAFAKSVYSVDGNRKKAIKRIRYLVEDIDAEYTPHQAVETRRELASALAGVGAIEEGKAELAKIHDDTLGYWLAAKKEPQYVFWNEAFERACSAAPSHIEEYSAQFSRFAIGLSESEGRDTGRRVIYGLLKNSSKAPACCAAIINAVVGTGLAGWGEIVSAVLHGVALSRSDLTHHCLRLFDRLVIPFSGQYTSRAIGPIYDLLPASLRREAERDFVSQARVFADTADKAALLSELISVSDGSNTELVQAAAKAEQELAAIQRNSSSSESSPTTDNQDAVIKSAQSVEELVAAGDGRSDYGISDVDYSYARKAGELVESASLSQIEALLEARPILKRDAKFVIAASSRLFDLNATRRAEELYEIAEHEARKGNWSGWLGGEKIAFEKLRRKRSGGGDESDGFRSLVADFARGQASSTMVLPDLDEIFDLVAPSADWAAIWEETQSHLAQYREFRIGPTVDSEPDIRSAEELIGSLFRIGFSLACYVLTDRLRDSLLRIGLRSDGQDLFDSIAGVLYSSADCHRELSAILWKLNEVPNSNANVTKYAKLLSNSTDAVVSTLARNIIAKHGLHFEVPREKIPKFYELAVIGDEQAEEFELPAGIEPGSEFWVDNPWYWTSVLGYEIKVLSKASGLPIEAIRRRCADFMRQMGGEAAFGPEAERELRGKLSSLDLRFTFARMMPRAAVCALGQVVEELIRAQQIDLRIVRRIWSDLGGVNLATYEFPLEPRPTEIEPPLPKLHYWQIDEESWLNLGGEWSAIPIFEGWFVLAEQSEIVYHGSWKRYSAIRTCLAKEDWISEPSDQLFEMPRISDLNHLDTVLNDREQVFLCSIVDGPYGELRSPTLTIHPSVVEELDWTRSAARPLEILSTSNEVAAKTLRWRDGIGYPEPASLTRSGKGQIVLLSRSAMESFQKKFGRLEISTRVIQRIKSQDGASEKVLIDGGAASQSSRGRATTTRS